MGDEELTSRFHLLSDQDLLAGEGTDFELDTTKLTFFLDSSAGLTGAECREVLLNKHDIQFNKCTNNTVLLMVNLGCTFSTVAHLVISLRRLARQLDVQMVRARNDKLKGDIYRHPTTFFDGNNDLLAYFFRCRPRFCRAPCPVELAKLGKQLECGQLYVNANFVIPYRPAFLFWCQTN